MGNKKASALLISVLLTSVLLSFVFSLSYIAVKDLGTLRTIKAGIKSSYGAEGANEISMNMIRNNLPGYEFTAKELTMSNATTVDYSVKSRENSMPCSYEGESEWRGLKAGESLQIPLFAQIGDSDELEKLLDFKMSFYVGNESGASSLLKDDLVLRWKILGIKNEATEAISEVVSLQEATSKENPSVFGTKLDAAYGQEYTSAKYYEDMGKYYVYSESYPIRTFLENHALNYLVVTNIVSSSNPKDMLYIQFTSEDEKIPAICEASLMEATAKTAFGGAMKTVKMYMREGENLPVFDFVLYHTGKKE